MKNTINYPTKRTTNRPSLQSNDNAANRGMSLEMLLNQANEYYVAQEIAVIHKKPTPVQVVQVAYNSRSTAKITEAYYTTPSTTDYNGIFDSYHIDFEAKQTNLNALPLQNFHIHQIEHMDHVLKQGGICFVIIYFKKFERFFLIPARYIVDYYQESFIKTKLRKSFSLDMIQENGFEIVNTGFPLLDYLPIVKNKLILGGTKIGNVK